MDHIAILRNNSGLLEKILHGQKTVESRWYVSKTAPWGKINEEDTVYFKEAGKPVTAKAQVSNVQQFDNLDSEKVSKIIDKFGNAIGFDPIKHEAWIKSLKNKNYCILVFIKEIQEIEPFNIDKTGYGISSAWMVVKDVTEIKIDV